MDKKQIKKLQSALNEYGGYTLVVDGLWGKNTQKAVDAFGFDYAMELMDTVQETNQSDLPCYLVEFMDFLGVSEIHGAVNNPIIVEWHRCSMGAGYSDEVPYCASAMCKALANCDMRRPHHPARALSYRDIPGFKQMDSPTFGAIATKKRHNRAGKLVGGHVAICVGITANNKGLYMAGANQHDSTNVQLYPNNGAWEFFTPIEYVATIELLDGLNADPRLRAYMTDSAKSYDAKHSDLGYLKES